MSLTPKQAEVISEPFENKLVCALPGSGKTHTTISLANEILNTPGTRILKVTFTNAAANEMHARVMKRLGAKAEKRVTVKTFAKIMLEQHKPLLQGRKLIIGGEYQSYVQRVLKKHNVPWQDHAYYLECFDAYGRDLHWKHNAGVKTSLAYLDLQNMLALYRRVDLNTVAREVVFGLNEQRIKPLPFTHFLVDEFQDSDAVQMAWLTAHYHPERYFTVVGDDDQSIYGWRGAVGYQNMIDFKRNFNAKVFTLDTCFRCSPYILGTAQRLVEHNKDRISKDMHAAKTELGKVSFKMFDVEYATKAFLEEKAKEAPPAPDSEKKTEEKLPPQERQDLEYNFMVDLVAEDFGRWTVLARTNLQLDTLETYLSNRGIPALRLGGKSIFESPDVLSVIKLLYGLVHSRHIAPIIEGLAWVGECEDVLQSIHATGKTHGFSAASLHRALDITSELHFLSQSIYHRNPNDLGLKYLEKAFGIIERGLADLAKSYDASNSVPFNINIRQGALKLVQKIIFSMQGDIIARTKSLHDLASKGSRQKEGQSREGQIVLCTLTGSKGLEWEKVMIINVNRDSVPTIKKEDIDIEGVPNQAKLEEERRLLYVGMTRAEDELLIQYASDKPSLFLSELSG